MEHLFADVDFNLSPVIRTKLMTLTKCFWFNAPVPWILTSEHECKYKVSLLEIISILITLLIVLCRALVTLGLMNPLTNALSRHLHLICSELDPTRTQGFSLPTLPNTYLQMTNFFRAVISIGISGKTTYINDPMIDLLNGLSGSEFVNQRKHDSNAVCGRSSKNLSRRYQLDTWSSKW